MIVSVEKAMVARGTKAGYLETRTYGQVLIPEIDVNEMYDTENYSGEVF
jgi:hypothetical protein